MLDGLGRINGNRVVWVTSLAVSSLLLIVVFWYVEPSELWARLTQLDARLLTVAVILVLGEGVFTALRIRLFTGMKVDVIAALQSNAWYSLMLIILPARLGEVAAVVIFRKFLKQHVGAAVASIVSQRIYDLVVLSMLAVIALFWISDVIPQTHLIVIAGSVFTAGVFVLWKLAFILTLVTLLLQRVLPRARGVRRIALQARIWVRHTFPDKYVPAAIGWTLMKWVCNLGAIAFLLLATGIDLVFLEGVIVAVCYNFLAIIPLQTVGGFGVGEAGLMMLLGAFAVPVATAASVSIVVRAVLIASTVLFWALASGLGNARNRRKNQTIASTPNGAE